MAICQLGLYGAKCAIKKLHMSAISNFASVKLPVELVSQAKEAAQPLRRSAAGQIEYWATLGRVVEHSGLTVQEARTAIEAYEEAARSARMTSTLDSIEARFLVAEQSGTLAGRVQQLVLANRSKGAALKKAA